MYKNWVTDKPKKDNNLQVENMIDIISEIRSFKNELNISPGSFIDVSVKGINNQKEFIKIMKRYLKKTWKNK